MILSEFDDFSPCDEVKRHLIKKRPDVDVHVLKGHSHAEFCVNLTSTRTILDISNKVENKEI